MTEVVAGHIWTYCVGSSSLGGDKEPHTCREGRGGALEGRDGVQLGTRWVLHVCAGVGREVGGGERGLVEEDGWLEHCLLLLLLLLLSLLQDWTGQVAVLSPVALWRTAPLHQRRMPAPGHSESVSHGSQGCPLELMMELKDHLDTPPFLSHHL